jgi:hypothetical protein
VTIIFAIVFGTVRGQPEEGFQKAPIFYFRLLVNGISTCNDASLGVDSFKDSELEIYVLQLSSLTRLFFCGQIMCAEQFVPGNILCHCIEKDPALFTERWNPESRPHLNNNLLRPVATAAARNGRLFALV